MKRTMFPTIEAVKAADRYTICLWYRRLPVPETKEELEVTDLVLERFLELGGFTREISKSIGW